MVSEVTSSSFELRTAGPFRAASAGALSLAYQPADDRGVGTRLWLMYDIRQMAGAPQTEDVYGPNLVSARLSGAARCP